MRRVCLGGLSLNHVALAGLCGLEDLLPNGLFGDSEVLRSLTHPASSLVASFLGPLHRSVASQDGQTFYMVAGF